MHKNKLKKRLPIMLVALVFAASSAIYGSCFATDITGITGNNGTFDIDPARTHNNIGFRDYTNFTLDKGDIANLIFKYGAENIEKFVNLVDNQININGIVNTVRDGAFHNGEAVFVSPKGMIVGPSGVLNVGSLSILTPTPSGMKILKKGNYTYVDKATGKEYDTLEALGWHGNSDVTINGHVISRGDIGIVANNFTQGAGSIMRAGVDSSSLIGQSMSAEALFNALVNTGTSANSNIEIRSYNRPNGSIDIAGEIVNYGKGTTIITNRGGDGFNVASSAVIENKGGDLHLVNGLGSFNVNGQVGNSGAGVHLTNGTGAGKLTVGESAVLNGHGGIRIYDQSANNAEIAGKINNTGDKGLAITNSHGDLDLKAIINNDHAKTSVNNNGKALVIGGSIKAKNEIQISSNGSGGTTLNGTIENTGDTLITEFTNHLAVNGNITNKDGKVVLAGNGSGMSIGKDALISNNNKIVIVNTGANGMNIAGKIKNAGGTAITNRAGDMTIAGTSEISNNAGKINVTNTGNKLVLGGKVSGSGEEVLLQNTGAGGYEMAANVTNKGGKTYIQNTNGGLDVTGTINTDTLAYIANTGAGALNVNGNVIATDGKVQILNTGAGGMNLNSMVSGIGKTSVAITNRGGNMVVNKSVTTENGNLNLTNTAGSMNIAKTAAVGTGVGGNLVIQNTGASGMSIAGFVSNTGDATIYNKAGDMNITSGSIWNEDGTLYVSNAGNALNIGTQAIVDGSGANSKVNILNTGAGGMNIAGTVRNNNRLLITNKAGNMKIQETADVSNTQDKLQIVNLGNGSLVVEDGAQVYNDSKNGRTYITNKGNGGMNISGDVNGNGNILLTNRHGEMVVSSDVTSDKYNVILTNSGEKAMTVNGTVSGKNVIATGRGSDVILGNTTTGQVALEADKKVSVTVENGNLLNAGTDSDLIKAGGNLFMNVTNGTIGEDVNAEESVGVDSRDLTKSINVDVKGRVKAFTTDAEKTGDDYLINIATQGKDLKVDRIKADGKVILLTDVDDEGNTGSILNAARELDTYANVKGTTVQLMSSGSIGKAGNAVHFRQTDATKKSNVVAGKDVYLHARGEDFGEDVNFGVIKSKEGSLNVNIIRDGVVENAVAPGSINVEARKNDNNLQIKNKSNNPNIIKDYFDKETDK